MGLVDTEGTGVVELHDQLGGSGVLFGHWLNVPVSHLHTLGIVEVGVG